MKRSLVSVVIVAAAVIACASVAVAIERQIQVKAQVVFATDGELVKDAVPLEDDNPLYTQLKKLFGFKKYGVITTAYTHVLSDERAEVSLKDRMFLNLKPEVVDGKFIKVALRWGERSSRRAQKGSCSTSILSTTIVSQDGETSLFGGKQESFCERIEGGGKIVKVGSLILAVTPTIIQE